MERGVPLIVIVAIFTAGTALIMTLPVSAALASGGVLSPPEVYFSIHNPFWGYALAGIAVLGADAVITAVKFRISLRKGSAAIIAVASVQISASVLLLALFILNNQV